MRQKSKPLKPVAAAIAGTASQAHQLASIPIALEAVALIDAPKCAAAGDMSVSWWHAAVADGTAPQPVIRRPRFTRWRLADVRAFWQAFGEQPDDAAAEAVKVAATKASEAAQAKRRAQSTKVGA